MESISFLYYLRKILPDVDIVSHEIQDVLRSQLDHEKKVQKILTNCFKNKSSKWAHAHRTALKAEAKCINKLYPSLSFQYIYDQLDIFKDMPNRREIVLRIIVHAKNSEQGNNVATAPVKRAIPHAHVINSTNNNQPVAKARRVDLEIPSTVTSRRPLPALVRPPAPSAEEPLNLQIPRQVFVKPRSPLPNDAMRYLFRPLEEQNGISSTTNADRRFMTISKPIITSTVTSTVTKPATITSTASSTLTSSNTDESITSNDANISVSSREPLKNREIVDNVNYEVPDIMQYFDLPTVDLQLPVARNCTITSTGCSEACEDVDPKVNFVSEQQSTSSSLEETSAAGTSNADSNREEAAIDQPTEHKRDSQDSQKTEIYDSEKTETYSPPRETAEEKENEVLVARHYTVNVLSPTFIRIKQSLVPDQYQDKNGEVLNETCQQNINVPTVSAGQNYNICRKNLQFPDEPLNNQPSTSKQDQVNMNLGDIQFNLIEYVREITNASERTIKRHCKRLHVSTEGKPPPDTLNVLVDSILTITVDSEDSDIEDYYDLSDGDNDNSLGEKPVSLVKLLNTDNFDHSNGTSNNFEQTTVTQTSKNNSHENVESKNVDIQLVNTLCSMFPEACPKYIRGLCGGKLMNNEVLDDLITIILSTNNQYPKRPKPEPEPEVLPENQLEILKEFLPDADPDYLRMMCDKFEGKPEMVKSFINEAMEKREYPTKKDYLRRQQLSAQQKQYTTEFNVENFIKLIPDPHAFFSDPSRKLKLNTLDTHYALVFMRNHFNRMPVRIIQSIFTKHGGVISKCMAELRLHMNRSGHVMKSVRKSIDLPNTENIPLLQELAYYSHEKEINKYLIQMKQKEEAERQEAKDKGLMKTCSCCYDEEVLPRDIYCCESGCEFCKSCIVKSSEVRFGEGKLDFPCLMNCPSSFTLQTLQAVLSPKLFSKVAQKKALEEIKSAGIEELEQCPFCDFATIPAEGYNIFTCMNPECMKESCRMCKEPSHIPLRCDEIEKDEDVRARTFVENKMTEALLRKCWKCGIKFFKEEGCNKMTCSCGAQMCYVCGQPVTSYKHFNGNGGDRYDLCPLYSDTNVLNKENVLKGAEQAKAEIGNVNLKHDPTADVDQHFSERRRMFPQDHLLVGQGPALPPPPLPVAAELPPGQLLQEQQIQMQRARHRHRRRHPYGIANLNALFFEGVMAAVLEHDRRQ